MAYIAGKTCLACETWHGVGLGQDLSEQESDNDHRARIRRHGSLHHLTRNSIAGRKTRPTGCAMTVHYRIKERLANRGPHQSMWAHDRRISASKVCGPRLDLFADGSGVCCSTRTTRAALRSRNFRMAKVETRQLATRISKVKTTSSWKRWREHWRRWEHIGRDRERNPRCGNDSRLGERGSSRQDSNA